MDNSTCLKMLLLTEIIAYRAYRENVGEKSNVCETDRGHATLKWRFGETFGNCVCVCVCLWCVCVCVCACVCVCMARHTQSSQYPEEAGKTASQVSNKTVCACLCLRGMQSLGPPGLDWFLLPENFSYVGRGELFVTTTGDCTALHCTALNVVFHPPCTACYMVLAAEGGHTYTAAAVCSQAIAFRMQP